MVLCAAVRSRSRFALTLVALLGSIPLSAQVVATYDFEDGTAQGWVSFDGASVPANTTAAAFSGTHSLLATTDSGGAGPRIAAGSTLLAGATYTITGHVMLTPGEPATSANFTIIRTDPTCFGEPCFDDVGPFQVAVTATGWAQIGGSYKVSATESGLTLYVQLVGPSSATPFYLDDVVITETAPPTSTPVAGYTFEDGTLDGWFPFGSPTLTNTTAAPVADPNGGSHSLMVSNRTSGSMGPAVNLAGKLTAGATYQVIAYVLLAAADSSNPTATMTVQRTDCAGQASTSVGDAAALSSTAWVKLQGTYSFSNVPGAPTALVLYIQSTSATDSFYIDDVTISEAAPPLDPSRQDNTGISTNFEDGGVDGWGFQSNSPNLANTTVTAHSGTHSLLVTTSPHDFDGPEISVANKMYNGSVYSVSFWIKLLPTDGSTHNISVGLQVTLSGVTSFPGLTGWELVTADGNWHHISVPRYHMVNSYDPGMALLFIQIPSPGRDLVSFYIDDFQLTYLAPSTPQPGIPSIFKTLSYYFPVGAEIDPAGLSGGHLQLLLQHFNSIVSGNDMTWSSIEPTKGTLSSSLADQEVGVAVCNNLLVRGHNLVWANGSQTPSYAAGDGANSPANQATVTANIQEHVKSVVQHFGSKVYVWDVVNEPLDPGQPDCLVHGPFYQVLGKSYIDIALQAARQYAPAGTKLFINDYRTTDANGLACLVQVVQDLQSRGIPLDGIGNETHMSINYPPVGNLVNAINTEAGLGLDAQVTEMDMSVYNAGDNTSNYGADGGTVPPAVIARQGYLYEQYFNALRELKGKLSGVTFWGMADDDTWLTSFPYPDRLEMPLPFDANLQAKPAYWGLVDPTQLPGFGLGFSIPTKTGAQNARVWTVVANNPGPGTAYATQVNGFTLTQVSGAACTPVVTPPSAYPVSLGDITAGNSAQASFTIDFTGCASLARFALTMPWSAADGADTGTFSLGNQFR